MCGNKNDPSTKTSISSKRHNIFVRNFQRLLGKEFAIDGTEVALEEFCAILGLCKFAEMMQLLVFIALFSSERALFSA